MTLVKKMFILKICMRENFKFNIKESILLSFIILLYFSINGFKNFPVYDFSFLIICSEEKLFVLYFSDAVKNVVSVRSLVEHNVTAPELSGDSLKESVVPLRREKGKHTSA